MLDCTEESGERGPSPPAENNANSLARKVSSTLTPGWIIDKDQRGTPSERLPKYSGKQATTSKSQSLDLELQEIQKLELSNQEI